MQGVAQAVGMTQLVAIKSSAHPAYDAAAHKHFANAYDGFWKILGGVALPGPGYRIVLPDGTVRGLEASGLVLGIDAGQVYEAVHAELPLGRSR